MTSFKEDLLSFVKGSASKISFHDLISFFKDEKAISPRIIRKTVNELVGSGELEYLNELGHSFITISFNRSVRLSNHIYVSPPGLNFSGKSEDDINIIMEKSTSFGRGSHPTTKLCLNLIEKAFAEKDIKGGSVFDIGCGTGVLCAGAILLGMDYGYAVDIDPVALYDTRKNIALNGIEKKVDVSSSWPDQDEKFSLICANLRPDALCEFKDKIFHMLKPAGAVIISGFRPEEKESIENHYKDRFRFYNYMEEREWGAFLLELK